MLMRHSIAVALLLLSHGSAHAQRVQLLGADVLRYVRPTSARVVLEHVEVIDGTGAPPRADQNVVIERGIITAIARGADEAPSNGTSLFNLRGAAVMPGIVGMHDHLWYQARPNLRADNTSDGPALRIDMPYSAPRLYLAGGVTTIRTTGSAAPYTDLHLKRQIEAGLVPGPHMDVTGPYLQGADPSGAPQFMELMGPDDARETVAFWASRGVTSFKAYTNITRDELRAAIDEAHKRGLNVTGHLCSVTYMEAIGLGIDNLEHGFMSNTANDPDKKPDRCSASAGDYTLEHMPAGGAESKALIGALVSHHVAVTSTLVLRASGLPGIGTQSDGRPLQAGLIDAMSPETRDAFENWRAHPSATRAHTELLVRNEMALERQFVAAGGLLLAGPDPVGLNGDVPGFSDRREIELLVDAGFGPVEAIRIATLNGATYLGRDHTIGSVAVGKNADLLVVRGDPAVHISDIENIEMVIKDGVVYDRQKLLDAARGKYGVY
jgi:imidazolonepropionase-like amidohydrolase